MEHKYKIMFLVVIAGIIIITIGSSWAWQKFINVKAEPTKCMASNPSCLPLPSYMRELTVDEAVAGARTTDFDQDGYMNAYDNCSAISNPDQTDSDRDGYGDACDDYANKKGDFDNDGDVDLDDLNILLADRDKTVEDSACGLSCDLDGDYRITALDARKLTLLCTRPRCSTK